MDSLSWQQVVVLALNSGLVFAAAEVLKLIVPTLRQRFGVLFPLINMLWGPAWLFVARYIGDLLGMSVDLSPIIGIFAGAAATGAHQIIAQARKVIVVAR